LILISSTLSDCKYPLVSHSAAVSLFYLSGEVSFGKVVSISFKLCNCRVTMFFIQLRVFTHEYQLITCYVQYDVHTVSRNATSVINFEIVLSPQQYIRLNIAKLGRRQEMLSIPHSPTKLFYVQVWNATYIECKLG
jgi:hypothetical protein